VLEFEITYSLEIEGEVQLLLGPMCNPFLPAYFRHSEAPQWQLLWYYCR